MSKYRRKNAFTKLKLPRIYSYGLIFLLSLLLFSNTVYAATGFTRLQIAQQQVTTQTDATNRALAEKLTQEGLELFEQGSAESRIAAARKKWEEALVLWQKLGDKGRQAFVLTSIGRVYYDLGEKQKALEFYNQSLPLRRAVGDKGGEALTLNNIGAVYSDLGEKQKALEFYNQSQALYRAVGDKGGEASTLYNIGKVYDDLGEKQKASEFFNQSLPLFRAVGDKGGEALALNNIGAVYSDLGEKHKALEFFNQSQALYRAMGDKGGEALALNNIGLVYSDLGEQQKALELYNQSLPLFRAVGDKGGDAVTLNNIGKVYDDLGEKQKALEFFNQSLPLFRVVGDKGGEALALNNIGAVYSDLGEKHKALEFYNQSLPLFRAVGDKGGEASTLNNIGVVYNDLGEKHKALELFNQSLPLFRAVGNKGGEASILNNIGAVYNDLGEKHKALELYNQSLALYRAVEDKGGEAMTFDNIGQVYNALGEKQKALELFNQSLPLRRVVGDKGGEAVTLNNIGRVYDDLREKQKALEFYNQSLPLVRAVEDKGGEAGILSNIGAVYSDLGEKHKALEFYNQSLPLSRAVGDKGGEAITLNNIGLVYSDLGEKHKALEFYNQSLPLLRVVGDKRGEAITLNNIGLVYFYLGEKHKALEFYNQSLPLSRAVGDKDRKAGTLGNIAFLERSQGNLQAALENIKLAVNIIEDLRTKIDSKELRTSYFSSFQGYYKLYIDVLMQLHAKNPSKGYNALALNISEKSRARILLELLTESNAKIRKGASPELLAKESDILQKIDAQERLLLKLKSQKQQDATVTESIQKIEAELKNFREQYLELQEAIRKSNPEYANLIYPQPLELQQIQQQLDKDTLLLQYSLGRENSYLWAVTDTSLDAYTLPKQEEIEKLATIFANHLKQENTDSLVMESSQKLSQAILAPIANKIPGKRLVIVADGILQNIPFAALADPNQTKKTVNYQPLMLNHEIVNLPSVTVLENQRQALAKRARAAKMIAVLSDPVFQADDERITNKEETVTPNLTLSQQIDQSALLKAARSLNRDGWPRLRATEDEAKAILGLIPNQANKKHAFSFNANYQWVTNPELKEYRYLHFATHGFADPKNPEMSGIVLSLLDEHAKPVDKGYLRLGDIFNLDFAADLIVLSACETGLGKDVRGEGLIGLTRGLMYAGTPRAAVSLWKVKDEGTSMLMQKFYQQMLSQNKTPSAALRAAQQEMLQSQEWNHPHFWAGFTLQGEWN